MLILMEPGATAEQMRAVLETLENAGVRAVVQDGAEALYILAPHASKALNPDRLETMGGVRKVVPITSPFKLASSDSAPGRTAVEVRGVKIGGPDLALVAGPCGVESREQLFATARYVAEAGVKLLRAGAFKPRTSPYSFQGLGLEGLKLLDEARTEFDLGIVTEATEIETFDDVERIADLIQIGARNMQNFALLKRAGRSEKPVLLKRGPAATLEEWLYAAEYVLSEGNRNVILCERGIRTFEDHVRFTLPLASVPYLQSKTHLPVMVDPSHGTGKSSLVSTMARASVAAGADGLIVEIHPHPEKALSDGYQALTPDMFTRMMRECHRVAEAIGKTMG